MDLCVLLDLSFYSTTFLIETFIQHKAFQHCHPSLPADQPNYLVSIKQPALYCYGTWLKIDSECFITVPCFAENKWVMKLGLAAQRPLGLSCLLWARNCPVSGSCKGEMVSWYTLLTNDFNVFLNDWWNVPLRVVWNVLRMPKIPQRGHFVKKLFFKKCALSLTDCIQYWHFPVLRFLLKK